MDGIAHHVYHCALGMQLAILITILTLVSAQSNFCTQSAHKLPTYHGRSTHTTINISKLVAHSYVQVGATTSFKLSSNEGGLSCVTATFKPIATADDGAHGAQLQLSGTTWVDAQGVDKSLMSSLAQLSQSTNTICTNVATMCNSRHRVAHAMSIIDGVFRDSNETTLVRVAAGEAVMLLKMAYKPSKFNARVNFIANVVHDMSAALGAVDSKLKPSEFASRFSASFLDPFRNAAHRGFEYADIFGNETIMDVVKAAYEVEQVLSLMPLPKDSTILRLREAAAKLQSEAQHLLKRVRTVQDMFSRGYGQLSESVKAGFDNFLEHDARQGPMTVITAEGVLKVADNTLELNTSLAGCSTSGTCSNHTALLTIIPIEWEGQLEEDTYAALLLVDDADINQKAAGNGYMSSSMAIFTPTGRLAPWHVEELVTLAARYGGATTNCDGAFVPISPDCVANG